MSETPVTSDVTTKVKEKELTEVQDEGVFMHSTGDTYNGFFMVKKKDKIMRMHGTGSYTTNEGDVYRGQWESDKLGLVNEVAIDFSDGAKYKGPLNNWTYTGEGQFIFPDGASISGTFVDNIPTNVLLLTDPNDHKWIGKADMGFCWFQPLNHYYLNYAVPNIEKRETKKKTVLNKGKEKR